MFKKNKRRISRERALSILYAWETGGMELTEESLLLVRKNFPIDGMEDADFTNEILRQVVISKSHIDEIIEAASQNWKVSRMDMVDLAILRIGVSELLNGKVPVPVVINESVELGKEFGSENSTRFINGILHKASQLIPDPTAK